MDNHKETFNPDEMRDIMDVYLKTLKSEDKTDSFSGNNTHLLRYNLMVQFSKLIKNALFNVVPDTLSKFLSPT